MENNDIKKALEHCIKDSTCEQCQLSPFTCHIQENALALINSQEQRIKELTEESKKWEQAYDCMHSACYELSDKCDRLTEENERLQDLVKEVQEYNEAWVKDNHDLRAENERLVRANSAINNAVLAVDRMAKADTVRKMCQQIKEHFPYDADSGLYVVLDQIAKEMLEGEK